MVFFHTREGIQPAERRTERHTGCWESTEKEVSLAVEEEGGQRSRLLKHSNWMAMHLSWPQLPLPLLQPHKDGIWRLRPRVRRTLHRHNFWPRNCWPPPLPRQNKLPSPRWKDLCESSNVVAILRQSYAACHSSLHGHSSNCKCRDLLRPLQLRPRP